jgi:hypothetical protein
VAGPRSRDPAALVNQPAGAPCRADGAARPGGPPALRRRRPGAIISLTSQGRDTLREAAPPHVDSVRRHLVGLLTAEEIAALDAIAGKVVAHLAGETPG